VLQENPRQRELTRVRSFQSAIVFFTRKPMEFPSCEARKAIGTDQAKDMAPLAGKAGVGFEREALLMFYDALNEQRHLVGVMLGLESSPALKKFLESTQAQLD
jgi:hypothetical protein